MRARISVSLAALCVSATCVIADTPRLRVAGEIKAVATESARLLIEKGGFRVLSVPPALRASLGALTTVDGGGGDVADITSTQIAYSDPADGNVVLLVWAENTINPTGVNLYVNDDLLGSIPGEPVPGFNFVFITGFGNGLFTIRVESIDDGSVSETDQLFLPAQPFSDAVNLTCRPGDVAGPDSCSIEASWDNPGPLPDEYVVLLNGLLLGSVPGDSLGVAIDGASPGEYILTVVGFQSDPDGNGDYRGGFVETTCVLTCIPVQEVPALGGVAALALVVSILSLGLVALRRKTAARNAA